jgi:DNA-binding NarL/FixJ family response regulator
VARVAAFIPDLLFGSNVLGALQAAGHEVRLIGDPAAAGDADVLIVDLTADASQRIELVRAARPQHARTLAFYSHVENEVREQAQAAGLDMVVPRSRMAREGAALVQRLSAADQ